MIIFLYGKDTFRSHERLSEIKNKFFKKSGLGSNLSVLDFEEKTDNQLEGVTGTGGLFSSKQLIIVKNLSSSGSADKQKSVLDFLKSRKDLEESQDLVIVFWENEIPKKGDLFKFLEKNSKKQNFEKLSGTKLSSWIVKKVQEINPAVSFSHRALEQLISCLGDDLHQINSELEKLASFKESGIITKEDIDILVTSGASTTIFETIEAASSGNKKRALRLFHKQLENKEDPFYILSMYVYQFRNLLKIGELCWQGMTSKYQLASETKIHPFVVQKTLPQLRNFTLLRLKNIYGKIQKLDEEAKTGKLHDIRLGLDKLIAEM